MAKQEESEVKVPKLGDTHWHEYAMSFFAEDELKDSRPNVAGLRRVCSVLLGDILESEPVQIFPVAGNGYGRATVQWRIRIKFSDDTVRTFGDVADVFAENVDPLFMNYAVATAGTRAEARAIRKALQLKVVAAEEVCEKPRPNQESVFYTEKSTVTPQVEMISPEQKKLLDTKLKKANINGMKFINSGEGKYVSINKVTREQAAAMLLHLQKLNPIPDELKGYEPDWMG